jgi:hypothetical protein
LWAQRNERKSAEEKHGIRKCRIAIEQMRNTLFKIANMKIANMKIANGKLLNKKILNKKIANEKYII